MNGDDMPFKLSDDNNLISFDIFQYYTAQLVIGTQVKKLLKILKKWLRNCKSFVDNFRTHNVYFNLESRLAVQIILCVFGISFSFEIKY